MRIIVCGAGEVGTHATEVLSAIGNALTLIDAAPARLRALSDEFDVRTLVGDCSFAHVLVEAGAEEADLLVAATSNDQVNLLTASIAKSLGTRKTIARVHQTEYFRQLGFDYQGRLGVDRLICPEYSTAIAIAQTLRNPAAIAIENFAGGSIEMEQFPVDEGRPTIGKTLAEIPMPAGSRLAVITREREAFVPDGGTRIESGDTVVLVGDAKVFNQARKLFHEGKGRRSVVLSGGPEMAVWLCETLRDRSFALRLFEPNRARAEELAAELPWVTVLAADPTDRSVFLEENIATADVFVALRNDDEDNIVACVLAKSRGVEQTIAVVQRSTYLDLLYDIGVDRAFSPRKVAARQIQAVMDDRHLRLLASFADGRIAVYRALVGPDSELVGRRLRTVRLTPDWSVIVIRRDGISWVPGADDELRPGDYAVMIGHERRDDALRELLDVRDDA
ncbi:MAG TPA: Trk system potassium transporter TrkA [Phycisphaerales bacterium]|nr:Trk system potassium transporter TrkA [Phycisphaerales bacterium]HMP36305.1 Trk system potassium transporter TrkA [Phycisphaerales bacterium]